MRNVGIIGNGFVGSSISSGFSLHSNVRIYDVDERKSTDSLGNVIKKSEFIFVCVPTPMNINDNNSIDLSYITNVLAECSTFKMDHDPVFIIKSTTIPGSMEKLAEKFPNLNIVYNPEFLTERCARLDFINASRIVLGGSGEPLDRAESLFRDRFPHTKIIKCDFATAQFIKYMANCFFSVKVGFMNEMKQASDVLGVDWETALNGFVSDGRVGNSHLDVPGHDGQRGFGGKCFPKDLNAFISMFNAIGVEPTIMMATWKKNLEVRNEQDWSIDGATTS